MEFLINMELTIEQKNSILDEAIEKIKDRKAIGMCRALEESFKEVTNEKVKRAELVKYFPGFQEEKYNAFHKYYPVKQTNEYWDSSDFWWEAIDRRVAFLKSLKE